MLHVFTIIKFHNLPDYQHIGFTFMYKWSMLYAKCTVQDTHFLSELSPFAAMSTGSIIMRSQKQKPKKKPKFVWCNTEVFKYGYLLYPNLGK